MKKHAWAIVLAAWIAGGCTPKMREDPLAPPSPTPPPPAAAPSESAAVVPVPDSKGLTMTRFTLELDRDAEVVHLTGDFAGWNPEAIAMRRSAARPRVWTADYALPRGAHQYKFVVDRKDWLADPANPRVTPDGHAGVNSVLYVGLTAEEIAAEEKSRLETMKKIALPSLAGVRQTPEEQFAPRVGLGERQPRPTERGGVPSELASLLVKGVGVRQVAEEGRRLIERLAAERRLPLLDGPEVTFLLWKPDARGPISVAGDFNQWRSDADLLEQMADTPFYSLTLRLSPEIGWTRYCFVEWVAREDSAEAAAASASTPAPADARRVGVEHFRPHPFLDPANNAVAFDGFPMVSVFNPPDSARGTLRLFRPAFPEDSDLDVLLPRAIWVWTPPGYDAPAASGKRYPVLYMHDGQNVWEQTYTGPFGHGGWSVERWAERLIAEGRMEPVIIVGIANTPRRMSEYGQGQDSFDLTHHAYSQMLIGLLKPEVDRAFRTLPEARHTALMGSSMGGIISFLLAYHYPETFGSAACLSTAVRVADGRERTLIDLVRERGRRPVRVYLDSGTGGEYQDGAPETRRLAEMLRAAGWRDGVDFMHVEMEGALHNEKAWRDRLDQPLEFLFSATWEK